MHLISALASGVKGAESGTAEIYIRGTSSRATYYNDFEATSSVTSGVDVSLDANGGAEVYVNQYVDVVVKNSQSVVVRSFTAGSAAPNVEYIGSAFTGTDYTTGVSATNKPVNLQTILNKWYTSSAATDFNVDIGGVDTSIQAALGSIVGFFYNVKSSAYGALGDGTTDDKSSIQAAIDAVETAGGGIVFFPKGTYRITGALTLPKNVSLMGLGSYASILSIDHASDGIVIADSYSAGGFQFISGLSFTALQSNSGTLLSMYDSGTYLTINRCSFGGSLTTGILLDISTTAATGYNTNIGIDSCEFRPGSIATGSYAVGISGAPENVNAVINNSLFKLPATQTAATTVSLLFINKGTAIGNVFDCDGATNACTVYCIRTYSATNIVPRVRLYGNLFIGDATITVYGIRISDDGVDYYSVYEYGNVLGSNMDGLYGTVGVLAGGNLHHLSTRSCRSGGATDNSAAYTIDSDNYGVFELTRTNNTVQVLSAGHGLEGHSFTLIIKNKSGGVSGNISFSSDYFREAISPFTIANDRLRVLHFVSAAGDAASHLAWKWALVAQSGDLLTA